MKVLYEKYHNWSLSNISAIVKIADDNGSIRVWVNDKEKTHVKEEIFNTINWHP